MKHLKHFWPIILLFAVHGVLSFLGLHEKNHYISVAEHFFGGIAIAVTIFNLLTLKNYPKEIYYSLPFLITCCGAIFWEFYEFLSDQYLGTSLQNSIANTMEDMFLAVLSSGLTILFYYFAFGKE